MQIHYSAKFNGRENLHHGFIDLNIEKNQIEKESEKIVSKAIGNLKFKCEKAFNVDFQTVEFFEVYYFDDNKEISIFRKDKY
jgi:hypothetical protein